MTQNISKKLKVKTAKRFKESFIDDSTKNVGYIFIGKSQPYENEENPDNIVDSVVDEKKIWDNMFAAKKVVPGDIELVIKRNQWTANTRYKQYDDTQSMEFLLSETTVNDTTIFPMFVINSEGNVYKCICNNVSSFSLVEPTGDFSENDGFINTTGDDVDTSYLWKYMYNIKNSNKFLTSEWMPIPYDINELTAVEYNLDLSQETIIDGGLNKIVMTNRGSGYVHTTFTVPAFESGLSTLTLANTTNVVVNMLVEGEGILVGTYITSVSNEFNTITLSNPTISSGGGVSNPISIKTRVVIEGDGTGVSTSVRLLGDEILKIDVITTGVGFTKATVLIYGSGINASARVVLPPKFGHGFNPAMELGATNLMITQRIGEIDSSENNLISTETSFRQYGLLLNPHKYNERIPVEESEADSVLSQTLDITLLAGDSYPLDSLVYQGPEEKPTFIGYVNSQTPQVVRLTNTEGNVEIGALLYSATSSTIRPVASVSFPNLEPYSGHIVYSKNVEKIERSEGQAEEIKFLIQF